MKKQFLMLIIILLSLAVSATAAFVNPATDEILRLNMEGNTDDAAPVGGANDAANFAGAFVDVTIGSTDTIAAEFDAGDKYMSWAATTNFSCQVADGVEGCSVLMWTFRATTGEMYLFGGGGGGSSNIQMILATGTNDVQINFDAVALLNNVLGVIPIGSWVQVVFSANSTHAQYFFNGDLNKTTTHSETPVAGPTFYLSSNTNTQFWYDGNITGFRMFNNTLTEAQVDLLYNSGDYTNLSLNALTGSGVASNTELVIGATDFHDTTGIDNFTITISNSSATFTNSTTTGGLVRFGNIINITTYTVNITSNFSGGYFNQSLDILINGSTSSNFTPHQVEVTFNASQIFTGFILNGVNISIGVNSSLSRQINFSDVGNNRVKLLMKAGTFILNGSATGQLNISRSLTFTALTTPNITLLFGNAAYNLTAFNKFNNATITDGFTVTVSPTNLTSVSNATTTGADLLHFLLVQNFNYTFDLVNLHEVS